MEEAIFNIIYYFINTVLNLYLVCFAWRFSKNVKQRLSAYLVDDYKLKVSHFIISSFVIASFTLYLITDGIISYDFTVKIAKFVVETTAYSDPLTEAGVVAILGLLIFKQLSTCIEKFLSDLTKNMFLNVYREI